NPDDFWEVPYLPIDPEDLGRTYEAVIRVNSQSGKGGVSYILESEFGLVLPRRMQIEFSRCVQMVADESGRELTAPEIRKLFEKEYLVGQAPMAFKDYSTASKKRADGTQHNTVQAVVNVNGTDVDIEGEGNGPIAAFVQGVNRALDIDVFIQDY